MIITNVNNYPEIFVNAVHNQKYDKGDSDYSITQLGDPVQKVHLQVRHEDEITVDIEDLVYIMFGNMGHWLFDKAGWVNALQEERFSLRLHDRTVSGQIDMYHDELIYDAKFTSAWTAVYGYRAEWIGQLNSYACLVEEAGFPVSGLKILALYRDWQKRKAKTEANYPRTAVEEITIPLWPKEQQREYIESKLRKIIACEDLQDNALPPCTDEEMWAKPTMWAVMKPGRKSALRVLPSEIEAEQYIKASKEKNLEIQVRPGERTRCEEYCFVNKWCRQYDFYTRAIKEEVSA